MKGGKMKRYREKQQSFQDTPMRQIWWNDGSEVQKITISVSLSVFFTLLDLSLMSTSFAFTSNLHFHLKTDEKERDRNSYTNKKKLRKYVGDRIPSRSLYFKFTRSYEQSTFQYKWQENHTFLCENGHVNGKWKKSVLPLQLSVSLTFTLKILSRKYKPSTLWIEK